MVSITHNPVVGWCSRARSLSGLKMAPYFNLLFIVFAFSIASQHFESRQPGLPMHPKTYSGSTSPKVPALTKNESLSVDQDPFYFASFLKRQTCNPGRHLCSTGGCCPDTSTCLEDKKCCPETALMCGNACYSNDTVCCNNGASACGPATVCCGNDQCCIAGGFCCGGENCCLEGATCCGTFCCNAGHTCCDNGGCCGVGETCCGDTCKSKKIAPRIFTSKAWTKDQTGCGEGSSCSNGVCQTPTSTSAQHTSTSISPNYAVMARPPSMVVLVASVLLPLMWSVSSGSIHVQ